MTRRSPLTSKLEGFGTTIFSEMTALAVEHDAVNLGQGFPDEDGPERMLDVARRAITDGHNQYAPGPGIPALRQAIADHAHRFHGLTYDPDDEVTVTFGATEAVTASILAICDPGDEVMVIEPSYDVYDAIIALADARRVAVPLTPPDFRLDLDRLRAAVGAATRAIVINSPHNPTGSALSDEELDAVAELCVEHDVIAICDEVYEHLSFDGPHRTIASRSAMRDRTIRISSAAKTFAVTGWKIGWACAAPPLTAAVRTVKQYASFAGGTPFQHAVAFALGLDDDYFDRYRQDYRERRDRLVAGLREAGVDPFVSQGTFYVAADLAPLGATDGLAFCRELPARAGVVGVPVGVFCEDPGPLASWVRFATCKHPDVLDEGIARLAKLAAGS
ncbi:MAG: pyridoxal phosphate-dependent aminotransferase [Nitriliruptorales bacterium]|nr:pyridoxal phosphate-dependent aminotransferase [Nitriliruptorales bacterium]